MFKKYFHWIFGKIFTCPKQLYMVWITLEQNWAGTFCNFRNTWCYLWVDPSCTKWVKNNNLCKQISFGRPRRKGAKCNKECHLKGGFAKKKVALGDYAPSPLIVILDFKIWSLVLDIGLDVIGHKKILQLKKCISLKLVSCLFLMEFSTVRENGKSKSWNKYLSLSLWMSERMFINNSILLGSCHWGGSRAEWVRNFYDQTWLATFERACIILSSFFLFHGDALKRAEMKKK